MGEVDERGRGKSEAMDRVSPRVLASVRLRGGPGCSVGGWWCLAVRTAAPQEGARLTADGTRRETMRQASGQKARYQAAVQCSAALAGRRTEPPARLQVNVTATTATAPSSTITHLRPRGKSGWLEGWADGLNPGAEDQRRHQTPPGQTPGACLLDGLTGKPHAYLGTVAARWWMTTLVPARAQAVSSPKLNQDPCHSSFALRALLPQQPLATHCQPLCTHEGRALLLSAVLMACGDAVRA